MENFSVFWPLLVDSVSKRIQPRSQGLSSSRPLEREKGDAPGSGKRGGPGNEVEESTDDVKQKKQKTEKNDSKQDLTTKKSKTI